MTNKMQTSKTETSKHEFQSRAKNRGARYQVQGLPKGKNPKTRFRSQPTRNHQEKAPQTGRCNIPSWAREPINAEILDQFFDLCLPRQRPDPISVSPGPQESKEDLQKYKFGEIVEKNQSDFSDSESHSSCQSSEISMIEHEAEKTDESSRYILFDFERELRNFEGSTKVLGIDTSICTGSR